VSCLSEQIVFVSDTKDVNSIWYVKRTSVEGSDDSEDVVQGSKRRKVSSNTDLVEKITLARLTPAAYDAENLSDQRINENYGLVNISDNVYLKDENRRLVNENRALRCRLDSLRTTITSFVDNMDAVLQQLSKTCYS